ncbi:MAG TPA: hypothetical protein DDY68_05285 [Porphyromonadaceae bacterium]|nr:hypothetical protein [Porphyromonadaceae bacterium]
MSNAEQMAYKIYEDMHLDTMDDEVRECLIGLLTMGQKEDVQYDETPLPDFNTYEEAMALGGVDIETARKEMHTYIDELASEYNLK